MCSAKTLDALGQIEYQKELSTPAAYLKFYWLDQSARHYLVMKRAGPSSRGSLKKLK